jgi:hypothetical protein
MKKRARPPRKARSLPEEHARLFVPFPFTPMNGLYDLRQPDFRPMVNSVVSGGAGQAPVETWSTIYAKLGGSAR